MSDGVVVASTTTAHWAWVGLRLLPTSTPADTTVERAWLAGLWTTDHGARWELRYTSGRPVSCVLLGRAHGRDPATVVAAAVALRQRLANTPGHIRAEQIMDTNEVHASLAPTDRKSQFELRKRLDWSLSSRQDTNRRVCFAVTPLAAGGVSWEAVWQSLARLSSPTTVGVYLEPSTALAGRLGLLAAEYTTLASTGRSSPMWKVESPPDPFAAAAEPGYIEAVRRYANRCYRLRISVAAEGPVDPSFVAQLAATTGTVACPVAPDDAAVAWRNLATMNREWLDETYRQGSPAGELDDAERILCDVVDDAEASAAFRLPSHLPLFESAKKPTGKRVFVSYVQEDLTLVEKLVADLRHAGYDVWMDRSRLLPGHRWRSEIKRAIANADFYIACFSPRYWKDQTYMNEELIVAVERFRLMPRDRHWFIPAMLEECELPDHAFGPNETLSGDMQYADFGKDWDAALRLVIAVLESRPPGI